MFSLKAVCENTEFSDKFVSGTIRLDGVVGEDSDYSFRVTLGKSGSRQEVAVSGNISEYNYYYDRTEEIDLGRLTLSYAYDKNGKPDTRTFDKDMAVIINDYSRSNEMRAEKMYDDIYNYYDKYDYNDFAYGLSWMILGLISDLF